MARGLHLSFSARRRSSYHDDEEIGERGDWRNQWQSQGELREPLGSVVSADGADEVGADAFGLDAGDSLVIER
ncbi:unnamed protein product [Linum tenue]|uniref:Uncharacterized protein n=1 Tax=Linum tenue TaxID=586396 RepID=A0AAV0GW59_9ROSI|nr:unnamed protein product [Linum tenue]